MIVDEKVKEHDKMARLAEAARNDFQEWRRREGAIHTTNQSTSTLAG
jgi:hypothetical protein